MLSTWELAVRQERLSMVKETKQHLQVQKYFLYLVHEYAKLFQSITFVGEWQFSVIGRL